MSLPRLRRDLRQTPALQRMVAAARRSGQQIYLTGGFLRDRLLGVRPKAELDLTVEDPASLLESFRLARGESIFTLDAVRSTLRLVFPPSSPLEHLDLTRFRDETIAGDLRLRDFTVNALAVDLTARTGPDLIDPAGGLKDLEKKVLRPCTDRSFEDDPLRILRGVRLSGSRGLRLGRATRSQMNRSRRGLRAVAAERVRDELFQILQGSSPVGGMTIVIGEGYIEHIAPVFRHGKRPSLRRLRRAASLLDAFHPRSGLRVRLESPLELGVTRRGVLMLAALLLDRDGSAAADRVARGLVLGKKASAILTGLVGPSLPLTAPGGGGVEERRRLRRLYLGQDAYIDEAAVLAALHLRPAEGRRPRVEGFLGRYNRARRIFLRAPLVTGRELVRSRAVDPGPALGRLLDEAREAQDLGRFRDRRGALRWVRERLPGRAGRD